MISTIDQVSIRRVLQREHDAARHQRSTRQAERRAVGETGPRPGPSFRDAAYYQHSYLSIGPDQGALLYFLARASGACRIVEFGSSFGVSTIYLAAAASDNGGHVIGSEFYANKRERAMANLREAGLDARVEIRLGDATETLSDIVGPIDFVFLDGDKSLYQPVLESLESRLAADALIIADNLDHLTGDPGDFRHFVTTQPDRYTTRLMSIGKGMFSVSQWHGKA
ncbi:O-methyltransferase [Salinicola acroporae]|uniref:Methyltransferase n=1 Tax=Salinicola acroporae TaxID=1541440 RepID=A0ABT6I3R5_9GAMM|nr:class I SAM-dependent methyltransferase [Salinicola acroporae]MDH4572334.1 methyltransferase [Salinicola acroporae]